MADFASHAVYQRLRVLLVHGVIAPGTRLVESDWADRLGTNRAAIREAAMVLAHEGLLERGEKGGYFVPRFDAARLARLQRVREILELGALEQLESDPPGAEALEKLDAVCDQMARLIDERYLVGFVEADRRFHLQLVELAGNPDLLRVYHSAPLPLMPPTEIDPDVLRRQQVQTLADHREIVRRLRHGEYEAARACLSEHLTHYHRSMGAPSGAATPQGQSS